MNEDFRAGLMGDQLFQPRVVSTPDVLRIVDELFARKFRDTDELLAASVTDLIVHDFAEEGSIEYVRKLIAQVANKPQGPYQAFVLLNVDRMTDQAANALLKTFEDVAGDTLFLMTCRTPHSLLPTIRSRVVISSYDSSDAGVLEELTQEVYDFSNGSYFPLLTRILGNKIDRSQCADIAHALQSTVKDGSIREYESIDRIARALERISTSNVTAKYQIDTVLFDLLAGKK